MHTHTHTPRVLEYEQCCEFLTQSAYDAYTFFTFIVCCLNSKALPGPESRFRETCQWLVRRKNVCRVYCFLAISICWGIERPGNRLVAVHTFKTKSKNERRQRQTDQQTDQVSAWSVFSDMLKAFLEYLWNVRLLLYYQIRTRLSKWIVEKERVKVSASPKCGMEEPTEWCWSHDWVSIVIKWMAPERLWMLLHRAEGTLWCV